jgi:O-antigen/teichoic acid export membrane protein
MALKWLRTGSFAALDQAWLSAINFGISIAFIRYGEKAEYGLYVLLLSPIYLIQGIQNAVFLSPFVTLYPQRPSSGKSSAIQYLVWGQLVFVGLAATLGFLVLLGYQWAMASPLDVPMAIAFSAAIAGALAREASRSFQYVHGRAGWALAGDLLYGTVIISAIALLISKGSISAMAILAIIGVAGILPLIRSAFGSARASFALPAAERTAFWACGRWAVIGVGVTWVNLSMYPYIAAASFGVTSVAEINAARLFMMPLVLGLPAWSNMLRPKFSNWFAEKQLSRMRDVSIKSALLGCALVLIYIGVVVAAYPWLERLLGPAYAGILPLVIAWSVFFLVTTIRTVLMATLMVNEAGYKSLTQFSFIALLVFMPAMAVASRFTAVWIIGALILTELIQVLVVARQALTYWNRDSRG